MIVGIMPYKALSDLMESWIIPIAPCPKPRMTYRARYVWSQGPAARKYFEWKDALRLLLKSKGIFTKISEMDYLSCDFCLEMPKSWSDRKKTIHDGQPHKQRPDLSNLVKALEDAIFENDSHIHYYEKVRKVWAREPGIIIRVLYGTHTGRTGIKA